MLNDISVCKKMFSGIRIAAETGDHITTEPWPYVAWQIFSIAEGQAKIARERRAILIFDRTYKLKTQFFEKMSLLV